MKKRLVRKEVLDNGIRVVTEEVPFVKSVSIGVWVEVGSRDEEDGEAGLSHFLEHMMFKGTARRSAQDIAREIDVLGGELNAFTSREGTTFYTKVTSRDVSKAVNLLADLLRNSVFKPVEITREKQVVLEEIKMVEDDPEDLVHDLHTSNIWKGHPISHPILGDSKTVRAISRRKLLDFMDRKYLPQRIVISVAGCISRPSLMKQLRRAFGSLGKGGKGKGHPLPQPVPSTNGFRFSVQRKELEQVHLCMGLPGLPLAHRDRFGAYALNALLGGGMSSRLFQEIREKR
ncbi:MAG TPA: pitrilysin family protein, partial [Nitrospiria bacterium]